MRSVRQSVGAGGQRPYYKDSEMDLMCLEALVETNLLPPSPAPIRVERFVEKRFKCDVEYATLPPGVLGFTEFSRKGVTRIVLANELDDGAVVSRRRERSTLAHEAGHGLFHGHLFALEEFPSLFPREGSAPAIMCREVADASAPGGNALARPKYSWHEFQANRAIGGLLLPAKLVRQVAAPHLVSDGLLGEKSLPQDARRALEDELMGVFDVNRPVAAIRLEQLYPTANGSQLSF
jgi:hypothetical protein